MRICGIDMILNEFRNIKRHELIILIHELWYVLMKMTCACLHPPSIRLFNCSVTQQHTYCD